MARTLRRPVADGRRLLLDVMVYPIGWLHPDTDYIASFPPLNSLPTQYRVTVRGEQRWFAQCGFEATSVTWLFRAPPCASTRHVSTAAIRWWWRSTTAGWSAWIRPASSAT